MQKALSMMRRALLWRTVPGNLFRFVLTNMDTSLNATCVIHGTVDECEQRVVLTTTDILTGVEMGSTLTDQNGSRGNLFACETLAPETLGRAIATVT